MNPSRDPKETTMSHRRQRGFSLLELLVAMMIIGVLGTLGFSQYRKHAAKAHHTTAADKVKIMADGLDMFYIKNGKYPPVTSWENAIAGDSPLVKGNVIPPNMPSSDPWGQPYELKIEGGNYTVKCLGDPNNQDELGPIVRQPGKLMGSDAAGTKSAEEGSPK